MTASPPITSQRASAPQTVGGGGHIPALDGVRGVAILLVLYHHLLLLPSMTLSPGPLEVLVTFGLTGVDLFFVLSGFLITGILVENKSQLNYFRNFYARRTLRIFPLYYAVVFLALVVLPRFPLAALDNIRDPQHAWSYWLYLSNISMALGDGFRHGMLDVTWSLAIEEQFYLVWPVVVLMLGRPALMKLCGVLIVVGLLLRGGLVMSGAPWETTFLLTPCRMDGLVTGAFIALVWRESGAAPLLRAAHWVGPVCAVLFAIVVSRGADFYQTSVGQWLSPTLLAGIYGSLLVFVLRSRPSDALGRAMGQSWLRLFGKYSYALYLMHVPIFKAVHTVVYGRAGPDSFWHGMPGQLLFCLLAILASLVVAWVSWNLFERHFLSLKRYFPTRRLTKTPAAAHVWPPAQRATVR